MIIPEPLNKNRICLGHRGIWWAEILTKGKIEHGSMPFLGDSAIGMSAVLKEIEERLYPCYWSEDLVCQCTEARKVRRLTFNQFILVRQDVFRKRGMPALCA